MKTAISISGATCWEDLIEALSMHAYIIKNQHEFLIEEKMRQDFEDTIERSTFKRQT